MSKYRNFIFVLNNWQDKPVEHAALDALPCRFMRYGKEVGETGTPHLQGTVVFKDPCTLSAAIGKMKGCHVEVCKSLDESLIYCAEDGDVTDRGTPPVSSAQKGATEKERYKRARDHASRGEFDLIDSDIYVRHLGNLKKIHAESQTQPPQLTELTNQWLYGPPGTGKSSRAFSENPGAYLKGLNKWWDGYSGQSAVIVDDMDPYHKSLAQEFKVWAHHMPFPAETKGGSLCIRPEKIIVTSNYSIEEVWEDVLTQQAMKRRFTEIYIGTPAHPVPVAALLEEQV